MDLEQTAPGLPRAHVALRARSLLDVLDLSVRFCTVHASVYARLSLMLVLPAFAASWAIAAPLGWPIGWAAVVVMTPFVDAAFVLLASRLVFQDQVRARGVLRAAVRAWPRLTAVRLGQLLALASGLVTVGMSCIYVGPVTLFAADVALVEQARFGAAFARSRRLAVAHFGAALGMVVILLVARGGAAVVADVGGHELLETVLQVRPPLSALRTGGSVFALFGWWAMVPFLATARFFVYLDFRTRSEGWDIQTRFAAIAARANLLLRPGSQRP